MLQAGSKCNIIADTALLGAIIRSFSAEARARLKTSICRLLKSIAGGRGLEVTVEYIEEYPLTVNDGGESAFARNVVEELFGASRYLELANPLAASEDFSHILAEVPGAFLFLSGVPEGTDHATAAYNHAPFAVFATPSCPLALPFTPGWALDRLDPGRLLRRSHGRWPDHHRYKRPEVFTTAPDSCTCSSMKLHRQCPC